MRSLTTLLAILILVCFQDFAPAGEPRLELVLDIGHAGHVTSVALSADGKRALTGSVDKTAVLWDGPSGKKLQTFHGHTDAVRSVALSGDSKHVLTGSWDGTAILWEAANAKKLQTFQGSRVRGVALSDDGKHVWTADEDGTTRLWDPTTGQERCRLYSLNAGQDWLVVTPDGAFDGSEGACKFVAYREPGTPKLISDDTTRRRFHQSGLLAHVWKAKQ